MVIRSTFALNSFLEEILKRNGLEQPANIPLYQYQISEIEYGRLKQYLISLGLPANAQSDKIWCAAFCLFVAEWFRREYTGGWTWKPVWELLNYKVDANIRKSVIFKGLRDYWHRPVSQYADESNNYLGSVFREGGLPYQLLRTEDSRFLESFKRILLNFENYRLMGLSTSELVKTQHQYLPEVFQQDTTVELVTQMVEKLVMLVSKHDLENCDQPAGLLDKQYPHWRRLFPIPLDEETGVEFLDALLKSATVSARARPMAPIACLHYLTSISDLTFVAQVHLANSISVEIERTLLNTSRVELIVAEENVPVFALGVAFIQFDESVTRIAPRTRLCEFRRKDPSQNLFLQIRQGGQILQAVPIPASQLPVGEVPIGLKEKDGYWQVCGTASFSVKADKLRVILPLGTELDSSKAQLLSEEILDGFSCVVFRGQLEAKTRGDRYRVSTVYSASFSDNVAINGRILPFNTEAGNPIYLGFPKISSNEGNAQVYLDDVRYTENAAYSSLGTHTVKLKSSEGITLFHKKITILPSDFSITFESGSTPNRGTLVLKSSTRFVASARRLAGLASRTISHENSKRIELEVADLPPSHIGINVYANLDVSPISIAVPFPSKGALALDADGNSLARNLVVDDLLGCRLMLFPKQGSRAFFTIELLGEDGARGASYEWNYLVKDFPLEISLYELRSYINNLFSVMGEHYDAVVRIMISGDCQTQVFSVKRYACVLARDENGLEARMGGRSVLKDLKPVVMCLSDPKATPKPLLPLTSEGTATGYFNAPENKQEPCLIVPEKGSITAFRARYLPGAGQHAIHDSVASLYKAVEIFDLKTNPDVIKNVLTIMATDFQHSGWNYLSDLFENFGYLPLTTFQVWKELVKHELALTVFAFRLESSSILMDGLQRAFNVIWELIPLANWKTAWRLYIEHLKSLGIPPDIVSVMAKNKIKELASFAPALEWSYTHENQLISVDEITANKKAMTYLTNNIRYQELRQLHIENKKWPDFFYSELDAWFVKLEDRPIDITVELAYRKSIVLFPMFAAAVAAGQTSRAEHLDNSSLAGFKIRQLLEFDRQWFTPLYLYCVAFFLNKV